MDSEHQRCATLRGFRGRVVKSLRMFLANTGDGSHGICKCHFVPLANDIAQHRRITIETFIAL